MRALSASSSAVFSFNWRSSSARKAPSGAACVGIPLGVGANGYNGVQKGVKLCCKLRAAFLRRHGSPPPFYLQFDYSISRQESQQEGEDMAEEVGIVMTLYDPGEPNAEKHCREQQGV